MDYEQNDRKQESVYSRKIKAGKRRTYFFDVRETRSSDFFLTITESRKRFNDDGYDRHKLFLYKEDFNKFIKALGDAIDYVKTELMPDYDFDAFNHEFAEGDCQAADNAATPAAYNGTVEAAPHADLPEAPMQKVIEEETVPATPETGSITTEEVEKW